MVASIVLLTDSVLYSTLALFDRDRNSAQPAHKAATPVLEQVPDDSIQVLLNCWAKENPPCKQKTISINKQFTLSPTHLQT